MDLRQIRIRTVAELSLRPLAIVHVKEEDCPVNFF